METWRKRAVGIAVFTAAIALESQLHILAKPYLDPPPVVSGWKLAAPVQCGKAMPEDARSWRGVASARRICRAEYAGTPNVRLTLFDMPGYPAGGGAFDAWQKWPPNQPGRIGFWTGRFFAVAEGSGADRTTLDHFALSFTKALNGAEPAGRW